MITPGSRAEFRKWLSQNHTQTSGVWVVIFKISSGKVNLTVSEVVEEALCFGWIDSVPGKIDTEKYKLFVSPRKPTGVWSAINKKRVAKLIRLKLMKPTGIAKVKLAKKNGSWDKLNDSDRLKIPQDLKAGLSKNKSAAEFFRSLAPSSKKAILEWIYGAKTDGTRQRRVSETVRLAAQRIRANHYLDLKQLKGK